MEKKKNAEPVTLFSNDTIEIIDDGADYFTKDALMYGLLCFRAIIDPESTYLKGCLQDEQEN